MPVRGLGEQAGDGGFACAGRAPEDQGREGSGLTIRASGPPGASKWSWPITAASVCGRSRSARGRGA